MATRMKRKLARTPNPTTNTGTPSELPTFLDHVHELRRRLFWVVAVILVASSAAYPFLDSILSVLTAPLGGQQLYYLTPVGGLSFSIKICIYIGVMAAVPFIMYHLYRYLEPLMGKQLRKSALFYVGLSTAFAVAGVLFAYFVSLPGALHFLTGMDLKNIQAMLTVDSYLTFVMTYLLGAALLFQIPLLLLITNTMTPLKPGKLMKMQRYVIVAAFILAAVISPTPDLLNQVIFAIPIILMYEIGVVLVMLQNRARAKRARKKAALPVFEVTQIAAIVPQQVAAPVLAPPVVAASPPQPRRVVSMDGFAPRRPNTVVKLAAAQPVDGIVRTTLARRPLTPPARKITVPARSVDGFMRMRPPQIASSP